MNDLEGLVLSIDNVTKQFVDYTVRLKQIETALVDVVELQDQLNKMHIESADVIIRSFHSETTSNDRDWAAKMKDVYLKLKKAQALASQEEYDRLKDKIRIAEKELKFSRDVLNGYLSIPITIAFIEKNFQ